MTESDDQRQESAPVSSAAIFDASPLIFIDHLGYIPALREFHSDVIISNAVSLELGGRPGVFGSHVPDLDWVIVQKPQEHFLRLVLQGPPAIDSGEAETIALALETGARVFVDDGGGRKRAGKLGINVTGTIGEVLALHRVGLTRRYSRRTMAEDLHALRLAGMHISEDLLLRVLDEIRHND